jgi:hypothetical protein
MEKSFLKAISHSPGHEILYILVETEDSWTWLQEPNTGPYSEPY